LLVALVRSNWRGNCVSPQIHGQTIMDIEEGGRFERRIVLLETDSPAKSVRNADADGRTGQDVLGHAGGINALGLHPQSAAALFFRINHCGYTVWSKVDR
jgi:hypothetical protein